MVTMAYLDLYGVLILLPQTVLFEFNLMPDAVYVAEGGISVVCYLFVQVAMVIDRVFAVFLPFKYLLYRGRINKVLVISVLVYAIGMTLIQAVLLLATDTNSELAKSFIDGSLLGTFLIVFLMTICVYPAIAVKLWRQKLKIHVNTIVNAKEKSVNQTREAHIKALRLYIGVLGLFVLANAPVVALVITARVRSLNYFLYFNCIGNPVVYYMFNEKFRNNVVALIAKLTGKFKT